MLKSGQVNGFYPAKMSLTSLCHVPHLFSKCLGASKFGYVLVLTNICCHLNQWPGHYTGHIFVNPNMTSQSRCVLFPALSNKRMCDIHFQSIIDNYVSEDFL